MRRTKIIATLGPASGNAETIRSLTQGGVNIFRLNMSHAPHDAVRTHVGLIRKISTELGLVVGVLLDTQGPAIRTGTLPAPLQLVVGDQVEFTVEGVAPKLAISTTVNYAGLPDDLAVGNTVLVDNGLIQMRVLESSAGRVRCEVLTAGELGSRRHINLPGVRVRLPALTEKDLADVALGAELNVDFVSLSFCRDAEAVRTLRAALNDLGSTARIVAKIEDQGAVADIEEIIAETDAIMIARGDLGIEVPMEELPIIQRRIVRRCRRAGRPVITATHLLESMLENPIPTRAEVTDVANACFEQADAIMLSGETAMGKYPLRCVQTLDTVARRMESTAAAEFEADPLVVDTRHKMARAAVQLADSIEGAALVVFTRRGTMPGFAAQFRPRHAPIFAFAETPELARRLLIHWGVQPFHVPFATNPADTVTSAEFHLLSHKLIEPGSQLVVISDFFSGDTRNDSILLRSVPTA